MAMTPKQEAAYALDYGVSRSGLSPAVQVEYDRLVAARQARREELAREQVERREELERVSAATTLLPNLGVAIYGGNVYQINARQSGSKSDWQLFMERRLRMQTRLYGHLMGAHAETMGGGLEGFAVVTFANGNVFQKRFTNTVLFVRAQVEAVRFNALAAAASSQPVEGAASGSGEPILPRASAEPNLPSRPMPVDGGGPAAGMEPLTVGDPRQVGAYRLRFRLGAGGMGRVFLGFSPAGRAVAVKIIHPELARDPEFVQRFRREVRAAEAVSGAYTAPVVAAGPDDDPPWLATAFVAGPSLADLIEQSGPLPEAAVWRLAGGLIEALQAVHAQGLVHRDLKPTNVLLAADGPRVIDFGIARALEGTAVTASNMVVGTPAFMSPEQAQGLLVGFPSDVFALGSVIAFAVTGAAPFGSGDLVATAYRIVHHQPDLGGMPVSLRNLAASCLAKAPTNRPPLTRLLDTVMAESAFHPGASLANFWPEPVARLINSRQDSFRTQPTSRDESSPGAAIPSLPHDPSAPA